MTSALTNLDILQPSHLRPTHHPGIITQGADIVRHRDTRFTAIWRTPGSRDKREALNKPQNVCVAKPAAVKAGDADLAAGEPAGLH